MLKELAIGCERGREELLNGAGTVENGRDLTKNDSIEDKRKEELIPAETDEQEE